MSRILASYDPNWEVLHNVITAQLQEQLDLPGEEWSPERGRICEYLVSKLHEAYDAQHHTAADYERPRREQAESEAQCWGIPLAWPEIGEEASRDYVDRIYCAYHNTIERLRRFKNLPSRAEWGEPVFRSHPPAGVTREIVDRSFEWCGAETKTRIVIERHAGHVHVCMIERPTQEGYYRSVTNSIEDIASILQHELAPVVAPRWWRRYKTLIKPAITFYTYAPQIFWGVPDRIVRMELEWNGERYHASSWAKESRTVPPILFEAALDIDPVLKWIAPPLN